MPYIGHLNTDIKSVGKPVSIRKGQSAGLSIEAKHFIAACFVDVMARDDEGRVPAMTSASDDLTASRAAGQAEDSGQRAAVVIREDVGDGRAGEVQQKNGYGEPPCRKTSTANQ